MRTILSLLPPSTHIDAAADRNIIFLAESIMQQAARRREIKDKVQTVVVIRTRGYMLKKHCRYEASVSPFLSPQS